MRGSDEIIRGNGTEFEDRLLGRDGQFGTLFQRTGLGGRDIPDKMIRLW